MSLLVRKINKAKWMQNDIICGEEVSADAITNCIKTKDNKLSTWKISKESEINNAILAIVSSHQHLDTIDVVYLKKSFLEHKGFMFQSTKGATPIVDLKDLHVDISGLTYSSLGTIAEQIVQVIKEDKVLRYTKGMIRKLINEAIDLGRLKKDDLNDSLKKKL